MELELTSVLLCCLNSEIPSTVADKHNLTKNGWFALFPAT